MFSAVASSYATRACVSTFVKQIAKPTRDECAEDIRIATR
jgi:hypothetical protein